MKKKTKKKLKIITTWSALILMCVGFLSTLVVMIMSI